MVDKRPCPLFAWDVTALQFKILLHTTTFSPLHYCSWFHEFPNFEYLSTNLINTFLHMFFLWLLKVNSVPRRYSLPSITIKTQKLSLCNYIYLEYTYFAAHIWQADSTASRALWEWIWIVTFTTVAKFGFDPFGFVCCVNLAGLLYLKNNNYTENRTFLDLK